MTEASEKRYNDRKVVENIMINSIEKPIELSIEQKHTGKGNPNAVLTFGVELNNRQKDLLEKLSIIIPLFRGFCQVYFFLCR